MLNKRVPVKPQTMEIVMEMWRLCLFQIVPHVMFYLPLHFRFSITEISTFYAHKKRKNWWMETQFMSPVRPSTLR